MDLLLLLYYKMKLLQSHRNVFLVLVVSCILCSYAAYWIIHVKHRPREIGFKSVRSLLMSQELSQQQKLQHRSQQMSQQGSQQKLQHRSHQKAQHLSSPLCVKSQWPCNMTVDTILDSVSTNIIMYFRHI